MHKKDVDLRKSASLSRILILAREINTQADEIVFTMIARAKELGLSWTIRACESQSRYHALVEAFRPDLLIDLLPHEEIPDFLRGVPRIGFGSSVDASNPSVQIDEFAIGHVAGQHFEKCGYEHFATFGPLTEAVLRKRIEGFRQSFTHPEAPLHTLLIDYSPAPWLRTNPNPDSGQRLRQWLLHLPKPVGLFCMTNVQAISVGLLCYELRIRIPDEIGIIGVGSDSDVSSHFEQGISFVQIPLRQIAWELVERARIKLQKGRENKPLVLPPQGVIKRGSTDIIYAGDLRVATAVRYIRAHLDRPLKVAEIINRSGGSRTSFEQHFRRVTGRSPLAEIHYWKIKRAKELLADPGLSIGQVAEKCGIPDPYQFSAFFKRKTGQSPRDYCRSLSKS